MQAVSNDYYIQNGKFVYNFWKGKEFLYNEFKPAIKGKKFDWDTKKWSAPICARNVFVNEYLFGDSDPYAIYDLPTGDFDLLSVFTEEELSVLWAHQPHMIQHTLQHKQIEIHGEPRTGKTLPQLMCISKMVGDGAWWIAPKSAIKGLKQELWKWKFPHKIFLMTYHKFRDIWHEDMIPPKYVVFDESHKLKGENTITSKCALSLAEAQVYKYGTDCYRVLMTGTPAPKDPADHWMQAEIACPGFLKQSTRQAFAETLGIYEDKINPTSGKSYKKLIAWSDDAIDRLNKVLFGLREVYLKKDCIDIPPVTYEVGEIEPTKEQIEFAKVMQSVEEKALQKLLYLRQISDGFMYQKTYDKLSGKETTQPIYFPCGKDEWLIDRLDEFSHLGRLVIYCGFTATVDKVTELCANQGWAVYQMDGRGDKVFNSHKSPQECLSAMDASIDDGSIDKLVVVAQADAASTGLEFSAASVMIYYSNTDNGAARMQSQERMQSGNQKNKMLIIDACCLPIDKLVRLRHLNKQKLQQVSMEEIQKAMKTIWEESNSE